MCSSTIGLIHINCDRSRAKRGEVALFLWHIWVFLRRSISVTNSRRHMVQKQKILIFGHRIHFWGDPTRPDPARPERFSEGYYSKTKHFNEKIYQFKNAHWRLKSCVLNFGAFLSNGFSVMLYFVNVNFLSFFGFFLGYNEKIIIPTMVIERYYVHKIFLLGISIVFGIFKL